MLSKTTECIETINEFGKFWQDCESSQENEADTDNKVD